MSQRDRPGLFFSPESRRAYALGRRVRTRGWRGGHVVGDDVPEPAPAPGAGGYKSAYPDAYSVERLTSYKTWWLAQYPASAAEFTPAKGFELTDPLDGLTNECRLTVIWGHSVSPPPPYPFRDEVWAAAKDIRTLRDGFQVLVSKGVPKFSADFAGKYWTATRVRGVALFDQLIQSMTTYEEALAKGPPLVPSWDWLFWGGLLYVAYADLRRGPG